MEKMKFRILFIFLSLISFNCKRESNSSGIDTINENNKVIMPFNIGNTWTYKTTSFAFNGDTVSYGTTTISIESDTIINGIKWYVMKSDIFYFYTGSICRNDKAGMYKSSLSGSEITMYPYPSQPGFDNPQTGLKIISIDTTYYTPLGYYNCYLYSIRQLEAILNNYYSPNIGPIHIEESSSTIHGTRYVSRKMDLINVVLK